MKNLELLVVGTGCCGTTFVARLLSSLGYTCSHEAIFTPLGLSEALLRIQGQSPINNSEISTREGDWLDSKAPLRAEASYLAVPFLLHDALKETRILHIVRNPLHVIESFVYDCQYFNPTSHEEDRDQWESFIYKHSPSLVQEPSQLLRAARYYIFWNALIEEALMSRNGIRHRIEDDESIIRNFLGLNSDIGQYKNRKANTKRHRERSLTIESFPECDTKSELLALSLRYGYNLERTRTAARIYL